MTNRLEAHARLLPEKARVLTRLEKSVPCAAAFAFAIAITGCGGSVASTPPPPPPSGPVVTSVAVTPASPAVTIGAQLQFSANVTGSGAYSSAVTWTVTAPAGSPLSPGTISTAGLYTTPYPAPASVTVTATSVGDTTKSGSTTVTLSPPATAAGPALSVDVGAPTHAISPYIYGMNDWKGAFTGSTAASVSLPVDRWGGDQTTRYNYQLDAFNNAADWYFENNPGPNSGYPDVSLFNSQVELDQSSGTRTMATVPMVGWSTLRSTACSFSVAKYGAQQSTDPNNPDCGNGILLNGNSIVNDPTDTSEPIDQTFASAWVTYLVGKFGDAANNGVAIYELDNEPEWWDATQRDVHPLPNTYDELTNAGLTYAQAIKNSDPTAEVSGPILSCWMCFFYSKKDIETGWATPPCNCANGNPVDRLAHGNIPLTEYYLQQFAAYDAAHGQRLLDYLDLHTYFAADNLAFSLSGDTSVQQARLNSTRVFWDSTYTDPNCTDPNNASNTSPHVPPQLIPLAQSWISSDYPGTKLAFTEYNWGGTDGISGALAQADLLGIFGAYGLDMATIWWNTYEPQNAAEEQVPILTAFSIYRNYDGNHSQFGDTALSAQSANQGQLSIYAAQRTSDQAITVVVINKTYGSLTSTLSLKNFTPTAPANIFLYSAANLSAIVPEPGVTPTLPPQGSSTSSLNLTFPAQSITVIVLTGT